MSEPADPTPLEPAPAGAEADEGTTDRTDERSVDAPDAPDAPTPLEAKTAADLEWPLLLDALAARCAGEQAAERLRATRPARSVELARLRVRRLSEAIALTGAGEPLPRDDVPALELTLGRLRRGATASGLELRDLGSLLAVARRLRLFLVARRATVPTLAEQLGTQSALDALRDDIAACVEPDGRLSDDASPELREARRRVAELRRELQARLGQLVRRYAAVLRDEYWTERDGRHVLPVRSDAHERVEGIVHGTSGSGATLYVEPIEVTRIGNGVKLAEADVERAEEQVRMRLSAEARALLPEIEQALDACIDADLLGTLAGWAIESRSVAIEPRPDAALDLHEVRHPLLVARGVPVIPNDMAVRAGEALVISGPNAGGKTVALKCIGLVAWMARAGLPIPLDPRSAVGWMDPVLTDVGDDQSLLQSLSTFSAHVAKLALVLAQARSHALVLLDEVAAGTDPEEGAALAVAVLEALSARGAAAVVTTHYERLKEKAAEPGPFRNASFGFDAKALTPTFRLVEGVPGSSSALAVAARYGIEAAVVDRARALVPEAARAREKLAERLEQERVELERLRRELGDELSRQRELRETMERERQRVREQERARLAEQSRQLTDAVRDARAELRAVRDRLRAAGPGVAEALREAERTIDGAARTVAIGSPLATALAATRDGAPPAESPSAEPVIAVGSQVWLPKLGTLARVVELGRGGRLGVQAGPMKLTVKRSEAEPSSRAPSATLRSAARAERSRARTAGAAAPSAAGSGERAAGLLPMRTESNTVDLRGMRVDEALERVDRFVDEMLRAAEPAAYVLHGHGTGALKAAVREHLALSRWVTESRPADEDDGGDAFTLFWLRG